MPDDPTPASPINTLLDELRQVFAVDLSVSLYDSPTDPHDALLSAELMRLLDKADPPPPGTRTFFGSQLEIAQQSVLAVPVEEIARAMNLEFRERATALIRTAQTADPSFGYPAHWVLVCSRYLFEHWTTIEGIQVEHSDIVPPFSIFLVRSAAYWIHRREQGLPIALPEVLASCRSSDNAPDEAVEAIMDVVTHHHPGADILPFPGPAQLPPPDLT